MMHKTRYVTMAIATLAGLGLAGLALVLLDAPLAHADPAHPQGVWAVCPQTGSGCDFTTIQAAIDAALPSDVIRVVGPGTYAENLVITKSVTLLGGCSDTVCTVQRSPNHVTTIDGGGTGRTVTIRGEATVITPTVDGFTITGGDATDDPYNEDYGGGIGAWDAAPVIRYNVITGNLATHDTNSEGYGGGVYVAGGSVSISANQLLNNQAATGHTGHGGGLSLENTHGLIGNNLFKGNLASSGYMGRGGGFYAEDCDPLTLMENTVLSNTGSLVKTGSGGGIYLKECQTTITQNRIQDNLSSRDDYGAGGGMDIVRGNATLSHNLILSNTSSLKHNGSGGGLFLSNLEATLESDILLSNVNTYSSTANGSGNGLYAYAQYGSGVITMVNTIIAHNTSINGGEAIYAFGQDGPITVTILNTTIASNSTSGILCVGTVTATVVNSILWNNGDELNNCESQVALAYSDVEDGDGSGSGGNFSLDPGFVGPEDRDYRLRYDSPCIDRGATPVTNSLVPGDDWEGDTRPGGGGYDVGADEFVPAYGARFIPALRGQEVSPGETVEYVHLLLNTGNVSDTFTMTVASTQGWATLLNPGSPTLEPYATRRFTVQVAVPAGSSGAVTDTTTLKATSWTSPAEFGLAVDVTPVWYRVSLPLILRGYQ